MKAVLLAAGQGRRLRPLTHATPKCLVTVAGRTLLDRWLDTLAAVGADEVLVNTHHLAGRVRAHVRARSGPPVVHLVEEPVLLGSAGTLRANAGFVADEELFLCVNADNLTTYDPAHLVDAHRAGGAVATLTLFRTPHPTRCGIVDVRDGMVVDFEEKPRNPRSDLANAGIYAFSPPALELIPAAAPGQAVDIGFHLLPRLVGRARAVELPPGTTLTDIGTLEALDRARREWAVVHGEG